MDKTILKQINNGNHRHTNRSGMHKPSMMNAKEKVMAIKKAMEKAKK